MTEEEAPLNNLIWGEFSRYMGLKTQADYDVWNKVTVPVLRNIRVVDLAMKDYLPTKLEP